MAVCPLWLCLHMGFCVRAHVCMCVHVHVCMCARMYVCVHVCVCVYDQSLSCVWLYASPYGLCGPPGSSVHGILQARILEWVAISSSRGSSWPRDRAHIFCTSCTVADSSAEPPEKPPSLCVCVRISLFSKDVRFLWVPDHIFITSLICNLVLRASVLKTPYLIRFVDNKQ